MGVLGSTVDSVGYCSLYCWILYRVLLGTGVHLRVLGVLVVLPGTVGYCRILLGTGGIGRFCGVLRLMGGTGETGGYRALQGGY